MSGSPRVLLVVQRLPPERLAGAEVQAAQLATRLQRLGARVEVLSTCFQRGLASHEERDGVLVRRLPLPRTLPHAPARFAAAWGFARRHARRFDVIHGFCVSSTVLGAAAGARGLGVPVVVRPSLAGSAGEVARLEARLGRSLTARLLSSADQWLALDDKVRADLGRFGIGGDRVRDVDNGVDVGRFRPATEGERAALRDRLRLPSGPLVVFVGQLKERKGVRALLRAFQEARARVREASLVVVGEGPLAFEVRGEGVLRLGARHDVEEVLRASDVFALPSVAEGFSNALLEALASGIPVVTTSAAAPARLGLGDAVGRLVAPGDGPALASSLVELLESAPLRERAGRAARALALRFDLERVARDHLALYDELRGAPRPRAASEAAA